MSYNNYPVQSGTGFLKTGILKKTLILMAGLFLFMAGDLFAQTYRELHFGSWISGKLRDGMEQWYSIHPSENGFVVIETSGEVDTYLEAYDASRNLIVEDDDGGEEYNAQVGIIVEAGKTYLFRLRGFDETDTGIYQIRASYKSIQELHFGTMVSGKLREGDAHFFHIRPVENGVVTVETFGETDTYLEAFGPSGSSIAKDDDGGLNYNARLEIFVETGMVYRIKLSHFDDDNSSYEIKASFETLPPDIERNTERFRAVPIRLGEPFPVYLRSPSESRWYRYDIPRSGTLFVIQTRGSLDTFLTIYDAQGNFIKDDDDSGDGENALISERLNAGTVYIEVKEYEGLIGRCTLHAEFR